MFERCLCRRLSKILAGDELPPKRNLVQIFFAFMKTKKIVISGFHSVMISRKFFKKFYLDQLLFCLFRNCWKESLELLDDNNSGSHSCRDRQGQEVLSSSSLG